MKVPKRMFSLLLSLILFAFSACSEGASENSGDADSVKTAPTAEGEIVEEVPEEDELSDGLPDADFGGYDFRILSCYFLNDEGAHRLMYEDYTGNPVNDALHESTLTIEDRFNVELSYISAGNEFATQSTTQTSINAGDDAFDIVVSHDGLTFALAKEGLFYNMYDVPQFNFDKPWWPDGAVNSLSLCGQLYCASSYISYLGLHWTRAMIINKDYAERLNLEIPYNTVREGNWTLDAMLQYVEGNSVDVDGNGRITPKDEVAFTTGSQTTYCLQEALDLSCYKRGEDNIPYLDINLEKFDAAVEKWRTLTGSADYINSGSFGEIAFKTGNVLLCYGQIGDAYDNYRETDMRYGFLPTPKADEIQENYINCCTDLPWAIPKTVQGQQIDIIGTVCEALSCNNYKNVLPAYFEVAMKARTADSPDDAEMLQLIADTRTISFAYSYGMPFNNVLGDLQNAKNDAASFFASGEKSAQANLEQLIETFEGMRTEG